MTCRSLCLAALAAVLTASPAAAVDPLARLCTGYSGQPKGFGTSREAGARPVGMVRIEGGSFQMGSDDFYPEEGPVRTATVGGFWIDRHEVTNGAFAAFVAATGYVTVAERGIDPARYPGLPEELTQPGAMVFEAPTTPARHIDPNSWWRYVAGADWRHPGGPDTSIAGKDNEPVVQVAFEDARAYATWLGRDLPTEAEWEYAARGGLDGLPYAWGKAARTADGEPRANHWQGVFPVWDEASDGFHGIAPVGCFEPNGYGLFDMIGNVWEWSTDDWTAGHGDADAFSMAPLRDGGAGTATAPADGSDGGAGTAEATDPAAAFVAKVIKGGSWLCSDTFCGRYRPAARQPHEVDLGSSHVGFRTVLRGE